MTSFVSAVPCGVTVKKTYVASQGVVLSGIWPPAGGPSCLAEVGADADEGSAYFVFRVGIGSWHAWCGGDVCNWFASYDSDSFGDFPAVVGVDGMYFSVAYEMYKCPCCVGGVFAAYWVDAEPICCEVINDKYVFVFGDAFGVMCSCVAMVSCDLFAEVLGSLDSGAFSCR